MGNRPGQASARYAMTSPLRRTDPVGADIEDFKHAATGRRTSASATVAMRAVVIASVSGVDRERVPSPCAVQPHDAANLRDHSPTTPYDPASTGGRRDRELRRRGGEQASTTALATDDGTERPASRERTSRSRRRCHAVVIDVEHTSRRRLRREVSVATYACGARRLLRDSRPG